MSFSTNRTYSISLTENNIYDFESEGLNVHILVKDGRAGFVNSECPDHICEMYGMLGDPGDTAVCLPAKAVLEIR